MSGDGRWVVTQRPTALALAPAKLCRVISTLDSPPPGVAAAQADGWQVLRIELPVLAAGPRGTLLFDWLSAQTERPRTLFATRDASCLIAGTGAAHVYRADGRDTSAAVLPELENGTHESIQYIGGCRFDSDDPNATGPAAEWEPFGRYIWVLPRIELSMRNVEQQEGFARNISGQGSDVMSSSVASGEAGFFGAAGRMVHAVLAVTLRWQSSQAGGWRAERSCALASLQRLRSHSEQTSFPQFGQVTRRKEAVPPEAFEAGVRKAVETFKSGVLQKVVLARSTLMEFAHRMDVVEILRQVMGGIHKRHYIFLLEPVPGVAYLSLTPERLCKVHGRDMWTEAVAGTWPLAEFEEIGEAALLASSMKHKSEHQLTADYIVSLLSEISKATNACDTHILKLRHLVHIKQSYHACAKDADGQTGFSMRPFELSKWFCNKMSPTPAVCGMPLNKARDFIREVEPFDRGFYAAPCGVVGAKGSELTVALRSALVHDGRKLHVYAGAGIVPGSDPKEEFAEISLKMRQFTEGFPNAPEGFDTVAGRLAALSKLPNLNTLWATLIVEELVRSGTSRFVICPGSRSTPLTVAVVRHVQAEYIVNHDERGAAYYAIGWAKSVGKPVAVIVTSGTAVANLLPAVCEAAQASVPLLCLTADRPAELRDSGANQTIMQPAIFGCNVRWWKDMPPPSEEFPLQALLGDIDLAVAYASGRLGQNPGPVQLNLCFRENLAPDAGAVRGAPGRTAAWSPSYVNTPEMCRWVASSCPRSQYDLPRTSLVGSDVVEELGRLAKRANARILVLVGGLSDAEACLQADEIGRLLNAAVFADITSGLRQWPGTVHYADQLLNSPYLAGDLLQIDAVVHLGANICSARIASFVKAASPRLFVRVSENAKRMDDAFMVTHHLPCSLQALAAALENEGLQKATGAPTLWRRLSAAAGEEIERILVQTERLTEPFIAHTVSKLLPARARLLMSSSMPIRDLDIYAKPCSDTASVSVHPPAANRGASGIDGVLSTAIGYGRGCGRPCTLVIGDVASLHDLNAFQQLSEPHAPALTVVIVNNGGGAIFSFLPIGKHREVFSPAFDSPHNTDFSAVCKAFGIRYACCETPEAFEETYLRSQRDESGCRPFVIEARTSLSHEDNVAYHRQLGAAVAQRARLELLSQVALSWQLTPAKPTPMARSDEGDSTSAETDSEGAAPAVPPLVLLHGWMGEKSDWSLVSQTLAAAGNPVLAIDLPGHGASQVGDTSEPVATASDAWSAAALYSMPFVVEAINHLLDRLQFDKAILVGYSLGGRIAMAFAHQHPKRVLCTVALSANPGLKAVPDKFARWQDDSALAAKLSAFSCTADFESWLERWYGAAIWGDLSQRCPDVLQSIMKRRRQGQPSLLARALLGTSIARQPNYWPKEGEEDRPAFWYVYGSLDQKFAGIGHELDGVFDAASKAGAASRNRSVCLDGAGHALVEEKPLQVAEVLKQCADSSRRPKDKSSRWCIVQSPRESTQANELKGGSLMLTAVCQRPVELDLKAPLVLSRGSPLQRRGGVLLLLQAASVTGRVITGVGEVNPLPQFHRESLAEAEAQLTAILKAWSAKLPDVPFVLARLDSSMSRWLKANCLGGAELLPSVRSGLEMALLHLLGRVSGRPHAFAAAAEANGFSFISEIGVNALATREEDVRNSAGGSAIVKMKVGRDPAEDAQRVNGMAVALQARWGSCARLRLDANQAWTVEEAVNFVRAMSDEAAAITEYIEEPVQVRADASTLVADWNVMCEQTSSRIRIAADESLTENGMTPKLLEGCTMPVAALVLKPALQGFEHIVALAAWALEKGARPIISSAFESGVALCHYALLAASLTPPAGSSEPRVLPSHGLGTFTRLAEDVLDPPFADLIQQQTADTGPANHQSGWFLSLLACQAALDNTADALCRES
eukprot:TRINITY_DN100664_c0_g1_i1.p1 TRINITY_DN100664_c0_g1~~TRINITY_DN100664_c0_g1_i1.p1  ORF type:complete len:1916 (+),score=243.19 TRINITY_DN100664_c0_g1_i1:96-5843(+)